MPVPQIKEDGLQLVCERVHNRALEQIVDVPVPQIKEGIVAGVQHVLQERMNERLCASAQDQEGRCGRFSRRTTGAAEKAGLLGLAKKTRFAAEHWEGQVHLESFHFEDAPSAW